MTSIYTSIINLTSTRENIFVVYGECEYFVCLIECFFNSITMMSIQIYIENSIEFFHQLHYAYDIIIHIAKTSWFLKFCMMSSTLEIEVTLGSIVDHSTSFNWPICINLTKVIQCFTFEWIVFTVSKFYPLVIVLKILQIVFP